MSRSLRLRIDAALAGRRADEAVLKNLPGCTRSEVKALFEHGSVRAAGRRLKKGDRLEQGAELVIEAARAVIGPDESIALQVLFESPDYVVVDKPAGLPTAPLRRSDSRSLAAALLARYPEMQGVGFREREPGLVHRLDNETSGVVLAARTAEAFAAARAAFSASLLEKRYLAVVGRGVPPEGEISSWLGPDPSDARRVLVLEREPIRGYAKPALTRYRTVTVAERFALVELDVGRAFRHQIRAHLACLGFPIAGDSLYGGPVAPELGQRHALHGSYIAWAGDAARAGFRAEAALPAELRALL